MAIEGSTRKNQHAKGYMYWQDRLRTMKHVIFITFLSCLILVVLAVPSQAANVVHVSDYGAVPNDGNDDTLAIREAFAAADDAGATVLFNSGEYNISGQEPDNNGHFASIFPLGGYDNLTIEGNGALLNAHNWATTFDISGTTNLTVRNLTTDWEEDLPFTSGEIIGTNLAQAYVDMAVAPPHTARTGLRAGAFLQYDPDNMRPATNGYDIYNPDDFDTPCTVPATGILRCYLSNPNNVELIPVGTQAIIRHQAYSYNAFSVNTSRDVTFENVTVYATPGMGLYAQASENFELNGFNVRIRPSSGRWMSSSADATHFETVRGTLTLNNTFFEGMGDDAFNVHTSYLRVVNRLNDHTLQLEPARSGSSLSSDRNPKIGDNLQIGIEPNPLQPHTYATVTGVVDNGNNTINITVAQTLPADVGSGALVANRSGLPTVTIQNCQVWRNRARGLLIRSHDVLVENCYFSNISGPAILIEAEASTFFEGIPAENVTIRHNGFANNNYGAARHKGTITVIGEVGGQIVGSGTFRNILIEDNAFNNFDGGVALFIASSDEVDIRENNFGFYTPEPIELHFTNTCNIFIDDAPWCANYQADFQTGSPQPQWQYLWNANGPIGNPNNYVPLLWNGQEYDSDGLPGQPDNTSMAYGHLRHYGGHTGQSTAQNGADPRYAIAAYTIPASGPYEIIQSTLTPLDTSCPLFDGFNLRVYLNETLVGNRLFQSGEQVNFDTFLGDLASGDVIYVAVGPNGWDDCDSFNWDFSVARMTQVSGGYRDDFQENYTPNQWQYLWNDSGPIGNSANYTSLLWNGTHYDGDGDPEYPDPDTDLVYGHLQFLGGHPGPSDTQNQSTDRYVIAAFTIAKDGEYAISNGRFTDGDTNCGDGNELRIYVNNALLDTYIITNGATLDFDQNLGTLEAMDTVYLASGPNGNDGCDWFAWDFSIELLPVIPPLDEFTYLPAIVRTDTP